jgi:formate hydrogenlyase subunit 3/multisubunit Na+/H+ antiporter MnhD subunit
MLVIVVSLLLIVAAACVGLSRVVATRLLGLAAAAACVLGGLLIVAAPTLLPGLVFPTFSVGAASFDLVARLSPGDTALVLALLWGGAMALVALSAAIAPTLRGFGAIFGWSCLALVAALLGQAAPPLSMLTPLAWAVATMASYAALRASGTLGQREALPRGLALGLLASGLLLGGLLGARAALVRGDLPAPGVAAALLLAVLGMVGAAPLGMARDEAIVAPAPLGALIYGLVMPILGLGYLLRLVAILPRMPTSWAVTLVAVGAIGALASAAGAYGERNLRPLLGWVSSAQASAVLAAAGLGGPLAALAAPALLINLMLSTIAGAAAVVDLERNTGGDAFAEAEPGPRLELTGALWAASGLSALGLPPLWGFWGRRWLFEAALTQMPWALPPLVAGAALLALALLMPLARFWPAPDPRSRPAAPGRLDPISGALSLAPLLIIGVAPQVAWALWLHDLHAAPPVLPVSLGAQVAAIMLGLLIAALVLLIARLPIARQIGRGPEEEAVQLAGDALGTGLRPLAWVGRADSLLAALWNGMLLVSRWLQFVMSVFEQRYYLLGVLVALLTVMLLMAQ